jgi:NAD(P)H-nitrite reductase large subunit
VLWRVFAAERPDLDLAAEDTVVCRCEEVTKAEIVAAIAAAPPGAEGDIGSLKRATRCGMGRCQARYCGPVLAEHLARHHGAALDDRALFAPRAPIKPIAIADLVAAAPAE